MTVEKDTAIAVARLFCDGQATLADLKAAVLRVPHNVYTWEITWDNVTERFPDLDLEAIPNKNEVLYRIAVDLSNLPEGSDSTDEYDVYHEHINRLE